MDGRAAFLNQKLNPETKKAFDNLIKELRDYFLGQYGVEAPEEVLGKPLQLNRAKSDVINALEQYNNGGIKEQKLSTLLDLKMLEIDKSITGKKIDFNRERDLGIYILEFSKSNYI